MLAAIFISGGWNQLRHAGAHAEVGKPVTDRIGPRLRAIHPKAPSEPRTLVLIDGAAKLGGGALLATGRTTRPAALLLATTLVPTTLAGHPFWQAKDPQERMQQRIHFLKNLGLLGGLLLAAADTEGRPGLSWRTRHLAGHARHQAGHARRAADRARRTTARTTTRAARRIRGS